MLNINTGVMKDFKNTRIMLFKRPYVLDEFYFTIEKRIKGENEDFSAVILSLSREEFYALAGLIGAEFSKDVEEEEKENE